jgi:hypothetical protein
MSKKRAQNKVTKGKKKKVTKAKPKRHRKPKPGQQAEPPSKVSPSLGAAGIGVAVPESVVMSGCGTVDDGPDDNEGFLKGTRDRMHLPGHASTAGAVKNLLSCLDGAAGKDVNIIGHGIDGRISTGVGERLSAIKTTSAGVLAFDNEDAWKNALAQLKDARVASLTLWGCNTGAGEEGASLVAEIAQLINAPVNAPTGLVYPGAGTNDFMIQVDTTMQSAKPGQTPKAKHPPKYLELFNQRRDAQFRWERGFVKIKPVDFHGTQLFGGHPENLNTESFPSVKADPRTVRILFDAPFKVPGGIPATVTGTAVSTFTKDGKQQRRVFRVYNNRYVQDVKFPDTFYHAHIGT